MAAWCNINRRKYKNIFLREKKTRKKKKRKNWEAWRGVYTATLHQEIVGDKFCGGDFHNIPSMFYGFFLLLLFFLCAVPTSSLATISSPLATIFLDWHSCVFFFHFKEEEEEEAGRTNYYHQTQQCLQDRGPKGGKINRFLLLYYFFF